MFSTRAVLALYDAFLPESLLHGTERKGEGSGSHARTIHAQEDRAAVEKKIVDVVVKLKEMNLYEAAKNVDASAHETWTYMDFPGEYWWWIRLNGAIERLNREIRRRNRSIDAFPDGQSALMLVCARLRHIQDSLWGQKVYLNMQNLE
jgi:putative transposase